MALVSTSATMGVLKTLFLRARRTLANAAGKPAPRCELVVKIKMSWIPTLQSDLEIITPPWLNGS
jgi:hypothetical protein